MAKARTLVGLDVHATKIVAAVLDAETGELQTFGMSGESKRGGGVLRGAARAGPRRRMRPVRPVTGLRASCSKRGVECVVAAPRKIPRASGDRVKTDRRDAEHLVRLLLAGKLHPVRVPGDEEEALRDLVRAREQVRVDLMRSRHRLSKLLLRHGIRFDDGQAWTQRHRDWLAGVTLEWPAAQATLLDARGAIDALCHRRERAGARDRRDCCPASPWTVQVGRLRCLRGVDTLTAVGLCAEIGDFERFARAEQLMSYVGLVPSRGDDRSAAPARVDHQDRVRARPAAAGRSRLALSQATSDRQGAHRPPSRPAARGDRGRLVSATTPAPHLDTPRSRAKRRTIIAVAAARELAGFAWAITQIE